MLSYGRLRDAGGVPYRSLGFTAARRADEGALEGEFSELEAKARVAHSGELRVEPFHRSTPYDKLRYHGTACPEGRSTLLRGKFLRRLKG